MQAQLEITTLHMIIMLTTVAAVIGGGIYAAGSVKSAEGYSLGRRYGRNGSTCVFGRVVSLVVYVRQRFDLHYYGSVLCGPSA